MSTINIRESLRQLDDDTFCKYDLLTMYDSCPLLDEDKQAIAKLLFDKEDPEVIYQKLCTYFYDDDVSGIEEINDIPVSSNFETIVTECLSKLKETYDDAKYNDVANQIEVLSKGDMYTTGLSPVDYDFADIEVFVDGNYDEPMSFDSIEDAVGYIINIVDNKITTTPVVEDDDDVMIYTIYDIVEDDNRLTAKCMNESTNDFEDIKLGKINSQKVNELLNNLLNNPSYKITNECKKKIYDNSAPWGLAVQMVPSVDVDGTNGLLTTGDFSGEASFGESVEESFEKDDRVTDGDRQGTVLDCDSQKVLVEWDYSETDDIEWIDKTEVYTISNELHERAVSDYNFAIKYDFHNTAKTGAPIITDQKSGVLFAETADEAEDYFDKLVAESKPYTNSYICIGEPSFLGSSLTNIFDIYKIYSDGKIIKDLKIKEGPRGYRVVESTDTESGSIFTNKKDKGVTVFYDDFDDDDFDESYIPLDKVSKEIEQYLNYHLGSNEDYIKVNDIQNIDKDTVAVEYEVHLSIPIGNDEYERNTEYRSLAFRYRNGKWEPKLEESLQETDEDGWGDRVEQILEPTIEKVEDLAYEVRNTVRGANTNCDTTDELADYVDEVIEDFEDANSSLRHEAKEIDESKSISEDALDDQGISKTRVDIIAKQAPNSKFYIDKNRYVLGKDLLDYFNTNEILTYSSYETSDGIRVLNSYKIINRVVDESKSTNEELVELNFPSFNELRKQYKNYTTFKDKEKNSGLIRDLCDQLENKEVSYDIYNHKKDNGMTIFYDDFELVEALAPYKKEESKNIIATGKEARKYLDNKVNNTSLEDSKGYWKIQKDLASGGDLTIVNDVDDVPRDYKYRFSFDDVSTGTTLNMDAYNDYFNWYIVDYLSDVKLKESVSGHYVRFSYNDIRNTKPNSMLKESSRSNYNTEDGWTDEDIELHKSIDWKSRNYEEYPVTTDSFQGRAVVYGLSKPIFKNVRMIKYIRSNPIFPPYYAPEEDPFKEYSDVVGPMYDGRKHNSYQVHDRYETQKLYDMLTESYIKQDTSKIKSFRCPKCHNRTLVDIDNYVIRNADVDYHDKFVCEECGAELLSEPQFDGSIKFVTESYYISNSELQKKQDDLILQHNCLQENYWYFTIHGVQPGSIPKGANVLDLIDTCNGTYVLLDRVLSTKELYDYDLKERAPEIPLTESSSDVAHKIGLNIQNEARKEHVWADFVEYEDSVMGAFELKFLITEGDWKHDHLFFNKIVENYMKNNSEYALWKIEEETVEESLDDAYTAYHIVFIVPKDKLDTLNDMRRMFESKGIVYNSANKMNNSCCRTESSVTDKNSLKEAKMPKVKLRWTIDELGGYAWETAIRNYIAKNNLSLNFKDNKMEVEDIIRSDKDAFFDENGEILTESTSFKYKKFKKVLQDELYQAFTDLCKTDEWGFEDEKEIEDLLMPVIEVKDYKGEYDNDFVAEIRGEFTYDELEDIGGALDPIVQKYDREAYFEPVTGGITRAYLKLEENLTEGYTDYPEVDFSFTNKRINGLPGITNERELARRFDAVGLDKFKIKSYKLDNVSLADIKDTFGGTYFKRHYGWEAFADGNYLYVTKVPLQEDVNNDISGRYDEASEHLMDLIDDEVSSEVIDYYIDDFGSEFVITYNNNLRDIEKEATNLSSILTRNGYKVKDWDTNGDNVIILRFAKPMSLNEGIEDNDELISAEQEFDSAATSINSNKLPAVYSMVKFNPGDVVVDFGGGKFDNAVNYLKDQDVTLLVYDPYNRSAEHNKEVLKVLREHGGADAAVNSNVLNVIKEPEARNAVLQNIRKITKKGAPIYITVYEGTGKGNEGPTKSGYQLNRKTGDYMDEISQVFSNVKRKGKLITAINESASDKRLSSTSVKYKGYRISLLTDGSGYAIFDKHGEMEDHGFKSIKDAKDYIDEYNSIYKSALSNESMHESYYTGSDLRQANLDALEYFIEFEDIYPFPKGEFLATDWKELRDGVAMGMDDDLEIAEGIMEYLQKEIDFNNKHKEIYEDDPQAELTLEIYNKVKREYEKEISKYESISSKLMNEATKGPGVKITGGTCDTKWIYDTMTTPISMYFVINNIPCEFKFSPNHGQYVVNGVDCNYVLFEGDSYYKDLTHSGGTARSYALRIPGNVLTSQPKQNQKDFRFTGQYYSTVPAIKYCKESLKELLTQHLDYFHDDILDKLGLAQSLEEANYSEAYDIEDDQFNESNTFSNRQIDLYYKDHPERIDGVEYVYSYKGYPIIIKDNGWYGYLKGKYSISRNTPEEVEQFIDKEELKESSNPKIVEASYGGAFDIEDEQYFTREDIIDFGNKVCEILGEIYPDTFDISDTYIYDNNILFLEVTSKEGNEGSANFKIDMRKIKKPSDLLKFADEMAFYLRQDLEELYTNNSIFTESASDWRYVASKSVPDFDGFLTDYTWYENTKDGRHIFILGDNDLYDDVDSNYADWETDSYSEARSWFDNYHGFDEEGM